MWRILATVILMFYVSSRAEACDKVDSAKCIDTLDPSIGIPGCTFWKSKIDCYLKADCSSDKGYDEVITSLEKSCHYEPTIINPPSSCNWKALTTSKRKYYTPYKCKFWKLTRGLYWMYNCTDEKEYGNVISKLKICHKKIVTTEKTSVCDREALSKCTEKIDIGDKCKYWQSTEECYTMADCSGEIYNDKVNSEIQKYCYDDPATTEQTTEQTTDTTTEQTSGCDREALSKCMGKKDNSDECKSAKGRLECYTEENCFDDNYKRDDMEKEKTKACDCTCKMRSSCLALVVMLALIKYLD